MEKLFCIIQKYKNDIIRTAIVLAVNFLVLLLLPMIIMTAATPTTGMLICIVLFFAVNPAFSLAAGIYAGRQLKRRWFTALFPPIVFWLSARIVFSEDTAQFAVYSIIYGCISVSVMMTVWLVQKYGKT